MGYADVVIASDEYELLYGQIGYISCFQFIQSFIDNPCYNRQDAKIDLLSHPKVINILKHTLSVGQQYALKGKISDAPLMYEFAGTKYLCSAHGFIGVLYTLLSMRKNEIEKYSELMRDCLQFLMSIKYQNGNYPSDYESIGLEKCSHLVQWCHGSPSYVTENTDDVTLFSKYHQTKESEEKNNDDDAKYNKCIKQCIVAMCDGCEHIWKYGLLTKGRSICHGVVGNAYSFLRVYAALKDSEDMNARKYLYCAFQFASFMTHPQASFLREPDNPDSLFEGVAGECCFTMDLMFNTDNAKFPCYDF